MFGFFKKEVSPLVKTVLDDINAGNFKSWTSSYRPNKYAELESNYLSPINWSLLRGFQKARLYRNGGSVELTRYESELLYKAFDKAYKIWVDQWMKTQYKIKHNLD